MTSQIPLSVYELNFTVSKISAQTITLSHPEVGSLQWPKKLLPNNLKLQDIIKIGPLESNVLKTQLNYLLSD